MESGHFLLSSLRSSVGAKPAVNHASPIIARTHTLTRHIYLFVTPICKVSLYAICSLQVIWYWSAPFRPWNWTPKLDSNRLSERQLNSPSLACTQGHSATSNELSGCHRLSLFKRAANQLDGAVSFGFQYIKCFPRPDAEQQQAGDRQHSLRYGRGSITRHCIS
jgi:hypothetical protein